MGISTEELERLERERHALPLAALKPIPLPDRVEILSPEERLRPLADPFKMAMALRRKRGHVYEGTVDPATKAHRRAKNRAARRARRVHRG